MKLLAHTRWAQRQLHNREHTPLSVSSKFFGSLQMADLWPVSAQQPVTQHTADMDNENTYKHSTQNKLHDNGWLVNCQWTLASQ